MPSFDVVSKVDLMELDNALNTARKELGQRYDFRGHQHRPRARAGGDRHPLVGRAARGRGADRAARADGQARRVAARLDPKQVEAAGGQTVRQLVVIKQGIEIETAKKIVKAIKDSKLKVQAQIQGDELRVSGKNRDDLQSAIALLRKGDYGLDLQFVNFRD